MATIDDVYAAVVAMQADVSALKRTQRATSASLAITVAGDSTSLGVTSDKWGYKFLQQMDVQATLTAGKFTPWYGNNLTPGSLFATQADLDAWSTTAGLTHTLGSAVTLHPLSSWGAKEVTLTSAGSERQLYTSVVSPCSGTACFSFYVRKADGSAVTSADCQGYIWGSPATTTFTLVSTGLYRAHVTRAITVGNTDYYGVSVKADKSVIIFGPQWELAASPSAFMPTVDFDWNRKLTGSAWTFYNASRGGEYASLMNENFATNVLGHASDYVVIAVGINDIIGGTAPATFVPTITTMASAVVSGGKKPIVATIAPWGAGTATQRNNIDAANALIRASCATNNFVLADVYKAFDPCSTQAADAYQQADRLHPNAYGHAVMADVFADAVMRDLRQLPLHTTLNIGHGTGHWDATGAGTGAISWAYTLTRSDTGAPIPDAQVTVTSDIAGNTVIAQGTTNNSGVVTFRLDAGTYYFWRRKAGYTFTDPDTEVVS